MSAQTTLPATEEPADALLLYGRLIDFCDVFAFQLESAPSTGYLHYQGYLECTIKKRHDTIQKELAKDGLHFEYLHKRKGEPAQAWAYSIKEDTRVFGPWTLGEPREKAKANKSHQFVVAVKSGLTDAQLFDTHPSMMLLHHRRAEVIRQEFGVRYEEPRRTTPLEVYLFFGPPGCGKTEFALSQGELAGYQRYSLPLGKDFWLTDRAVGIFPTFL